MFNNAIDKADFILRVARISVATRIKPSQRMPWVMACKFCRKI